MKNKGTIRVIATLFLALPVIFSACVKDSCKKTTTYTYFVPLYKTKAEVRANIKSNAPRQFENTGKLYLYGNYVFVNEVDKGIHVIDNSDPSHPKNIAFIDIPGNVDIAAKGNILYADLYTDLVAIDISNPANITVKKIVDYVFPERLYSGGFTPDNSQFITEWKRVDTTITESCTKPAWWGNNPGVLYAAANSNAGSQNAGVSNSTSATGIGGSLARFTIVNNYMYAVDRHSLKPISLENPADPVPGSPINAGWDIETIYPFKNKLFLGSMGGMFIFDISNPASPTAQSTFTHARACDPVIADDNFAYVTLRSGTTCGPVTNELVVVNVQNLDAPYQVKTYAMNNPQGLSKDNSTLFVCDGTAGLKVYNATSPTNLSLLKTFNGFEPVDVIAWNKKAIVVAKDGLYQYDYSNVSDIRFLSKITITH